MYSLDEDFPNGSKLSFHDIDKLQNYCILLNIPGSMTIHIKYVFPRGQNHPIVNESRHKKQQSKAGKVWPAVSIHFIICVSYVNIIPCCCHTERSTRSINWPSDALFVSVFLSYIGMCVLLIQSYFTCSVNTLLVHKL